MTGPSTRERALGGASALAMAAVLARLLQLGSIVVLARLLTKAEVGAYAAALGFVVIVGKLANFEARRDLVRDPARAPAKARAYAMVQGGLALCLTLCLFPLGPWLGSLGYVAGSEAQHSGELVRALALLPFLDSIALPALALLEVRMRFRAAAVLETSALALQVGVTVAGAAAGLGFWALVLGVYAAYLCRAVGAWLCEGRTILTANSDAEAFTSIKRFGSRMLLAHLVVTAALNLPEVLLAGLVPQAAIGLYKYAYMLPHAAEQCVEQLSRVGLAVLGRHPGRDEQARVFGLSTRFTFALLLPGFVLCLDHAEVLLEVLLGPTWVEAAGLLRILSLLVVVRAGFVHWRDLASVRERPDLLPKAGLVTLVLLIATAVPLVGLLGVEGMALANLAAWILPLPFLMAWCRRELGIALLPILAPALGAGAASFALGRLGLATLGEGPMTLRLSLIGAQCLAYFVVLARLDPELGSLVREAIGRRRSLSGQS